MRDIRGHLRDCSLFTGTTGLKKKHMAYEFFSKCDRATDVFVNNVTRSLVYPEFTFDITCM